jgi:hypothetical protein
MTRVNLNRTNDWRAARQRAKRVYMTFLRKGMLLTATQFCRRRGVSSAQLVLAQRGGIVFSLCIHRKHYYPASLADSSVDWYRLDKLMRRLAMHVPPATRFDFLITRRGSLGDKNPLQALRRGKRYRVALRVADSLASEYGPYP